MKQRRAAIVAAVVGIAACAGPSGVGGGYLAPASYVDGTSSGGDVLDASEPAGDTGPDAGGAGPDAGGAGQGDAGAGETAGGCAGPACCEHSADCDDGDPCTDDVCDGATGACEHAPVAGCGGQAAPCSAKADCKTGVCDPAAHACVPCLSSKDCGAGKLCKGGQCKVAVACKSDVQCKASGQVCAIADGACVDCNVNADCGSGQRCLDHGCVVEVACETSKQCGKVCDVEAGACVDCLMHDDCPEGSICHLGSATCVPALCSAGACAGGAHYACKADGSGYEAPEDCGDGNGCTDDVCGGAAGCANPPNTLGCDDGDACTTSDTCEGGECKGGKAKSCNDANPCTGDSCDGLKGCVFKPTNDGCDDGDKCSTKDACSGGKCEGGPPLACDDGNACTDDGCEADKGCTHDDSTQACDDGDGCTAGDVCKGGKCAPGKPKSCDDGDGCTDDACDAKTGKCVATPNTAGCDDGDKCTIKDTCGGGKCKGGAPLSCDDGKSCTTDKCDGKIGCTWLPAPDGAPCAGGSCKAGACMSQPPALGRAFSCALKGSGVRCFGQNSYGVLGGGDSKSSVIVADVAGPPALSVAAGSYHACARGQDGKLRCWGSGSYGQLGDGKSSSSFKPVEVSGLKDVMGVAAGGSFTCAWLAGGGGRCWGAGSKGQIGDGGKVSKVVSPKKVDIAAKITSIGAGFGHACAVTEGGGLWCWGDNTKWQVRKSTAKSYLLPSEIKGLGPVIGVAAGDYHTCALVKGGAVWCWGDNSFKQASGASKWISKLDKPTQVAGVKDAIAVAAGGRTTCALVAGGKVRCWGRNTWGQAGAGEGSPSSVVVTEVVGLKGAKALDVGSEHACAFAAGKLQCWGRNDKGQLGLAGDFAPREAVGLSDMLQVAAWDRHVCARRKDGSLWCWGMNTYGELGTGDTTSRASPVKVKGGVTFSSVDVGRYLTCARGTDGTPWCWGSGSYGALGVGKSYGSAKTPSKVALGKVEHIAAGYQSACAVSQGKASCWGRNTSGQLGDGTKKSQISPVAVKGLGAVAAVELGREHACALAKDGAAWCWGRNAHGQLGDGSTTDRLGPVQVKGLSGLTRVLTGPNNTCAIDKSGDLYCWGYNYYQQVGPKQGSAYTPYKLPRKMSGYKAPVSAAAIDSSHICAVVAGGEVFCQGRAGSGAFLNGMVTHSDTSNPVATGFKGALDVAAAGILTCAVKTSGAVWCAGTNDDGQLGDGLGWRRAPAVVKVF